ncbi:MAG: DUF1552 domain-containing protein [Lentisphaerales bacterium]|nr:DUF1552 domain-containing protein [Lentisphaerales bacterium]
MNRRTIVKAAALGISLPVLESFGAQKKTAFNKNAPAKRLVCVGYALGFYNPQLYPKDTGKNYTLSPTLKHLKQHRNDFTIFSGLDHRAAHGHHNWHNFLCGPRIGSITLDQIAAEKIGPSTKVPSFQLLNEMSFNRQGIKLPALKKASVVFNKMFMSKQDLKKMEHIIASGRSNLDKIVEQTKSLQNDVSAKDKVKLDEYLMALREVEVRMQRESKFLKNDPPNTDYQLPNYNPTGLEAQSLMYDMMALSLETDTSRVMAMMFGGGGEALSIDGKPQTSGYHTLSHHRGSQVMIDEFIQVDIAHMKALNLFLTQLKEKKDAEGRPLLDSTIVLVGTGMGDSNIHSNADCPAIVAGGGFRHGSHIKTDATKANAHILGDLYITLLNQLGIETESFANANRRMEIKA